MQLNFKKKIFWPKSDWTNMVSTLRWWLWWWLWCGCGCGCKISAACSSDWELEKLAEDGFATSQPQQARGSKGSNWELFSQRTKKSGRRCSPRWRRPNDKPRCLHWSNRFTSRRSIWPERRNFSCNTMRRLLQPERRCNKPKTIEKLMCKVSPSGKTS